MFPFCLFPSSMGCTSQTIDIRYMGQVTGWVVTIIHIFASQKSPLLIKEVTSEVHAANREVHSQMVGHGERVSENSVGHLQSSSL
jgi:hypothetical protein